MERDDRLLTSLPRSLSVLQQAARDDLSSFVFLTAGASLTEQIKLPPPVAYTTSLLEHSSVIMTLHDSTLIRSDSPRWSQHPSVLQLAPPPRRRANQWRWDASVCKCWVWTINYVGLACRGHSLTLFNTDFPKKKKKRCDKVKQPYKQTPLSKQLNRVYLRWCEHLNTQLLHIMRRKVVKNNEQHLSITKHNIVKMSKYKMWASWRAKSILNLVEPRQGS